MQPCFEAFLFATDLGWLTAVGSVWLTLTDLPYRPSGSTPVMNGAQKGWVLRRLRVYTYDTHASKP